MINEKINKSFLNIISPPSFIGIWHHPTIKCSYKHYNKNMFGKQCKINI